VLLIKKLAMFKSEEINIVVMGGSAKGEERIFCQTNYFDEVAYFYPKTKFNFYFAGPELSDARHN